MDTSQIITSAILAVVTALGAVLTRAVLAWITANVSVANQSFLAQVASIAVHAAEQLGETGRVQDKKAFATQRIDEWLHDAGLTVTAEQVSTAIEAAVHAEIGTRLEVGEYPLTHIGMTHDSPVTGSATTPAPTFGAQS